MVLFIQYVVLTFESVNEILWCYHSNETSLAELLHSAIYFLWLKKRNLKLFAKVFVGGHSK